MLDVSTKNKLNVLNLFTVTLLLVNLLLVQTNIEWYLNIVNGCKRFLKVPL